MIHAHDAIRARLLQGVEPAKRMSSLDKLKKTEWCAEFEKYQRNRMLMGAFRYGCMASQDYGKYDLCAEAKKRIARYEKTKNLEHLVDAGNIIQLAYIYGKRQGHKLNPIDDGPHTPEKKP